MEFAGDEARCRQVAVAGLPLDNTLVPSDLPGVSEPSAASMEASYAIHSTLSWPFHISKKACHIALGVVPSVATCTAIQSHFSKSGKGKGANKDLTALIEAKGGFSEEDVGRVVDSKEPPILVQATDIHGGILGLTNDGHVWTSGKKLFAGDVSLAGANTYAMESSVEQMRGLHGNMYGAEGELTDYGKK